MKRSELFFTFLLVPVDYLLVLTAFTLAYFTRTQSAIIYVWSFPIYLKFVVILSVVWVAIFGLVGMYAIEKPKNSLDQLRKVFIGISTSVVLLVAWFFLSRTEFFSRLIIIYAWLYATILVFLGRIIVQAIQQYLLRFDIGVHRLLVIGANGVSRQVIRSIQQDRSLGFKLMKIVDRNAIDKLESIVSKYPIDEVLLADPSVSDREVDKIMILCQQRGYIFRLIPNLYRIHTNVSVETINGVPLIEFERTPLRGWGKIIKRLVDIIGSIIGIIIFSILFIIVAIGIKVSSPMGPILFRQKRVGYRGLFTFYKFRTMVPDAQKVHEKYIKKYGNMFKLKDDPRIFPFGRFLRKYSIDELPQLFNVLRGEMSLVGPRPPMPEEVKRYTDWQKQRFGVKPGITGLWQVSGRSNLSFDEWVRLDVYYIEHWSLWLDVQILIKTILVVLFSRGAY